MFNARTMVSDVELAEKVHKFLQTSDLKKTTNNLVLAKLESDYGLDLSHKKPFLRDQVARFLQAQYESCEKEEFEADIDYGNNDDDDYGNDDVSNSDDEYFDDSVVRVGVGVPVAASSNNNNHNNGCEPTLKGVTKLARPARQNKEKERVKKNCLSGKFCTLSPKLQNFLGVPHMIRAQVVKHLWSYVRQKNLKDPLDGKNIICDETLRDLFGVDTINILQINKALTHHIWPRVKPTKKDKPRKREREEGQAINQACDPCVDETKEQNQKKVLSGFLAPLPISETLVKFLGTGESALTRQDVIKRIWEYIKEKNLQDPSDKKTVICDEKLKELLNVDSFNGFLMSKLLSVHFVRM